MKLAFISLGCAKNLVNTEQMMALTRQAGHQLLEEPEGADVAVLNTCGFIDSAKSEAIDSILALAQLKDQGKLGKLLVTGCLPQRYQTELLEEMPEVDGVLGTGSYPQILSALEQLQAGGRPVFFRDIDHTQEELERVLATPPYSAYLKIAEGCDNRCAYCVIPSLRGRYRSRPMESLLAEAEQLARQGCRELIVVAQDITRYGTDLYGRRALPELLEGLCRLPFHWVRLHYLYPDEMDDELIDVIAAQPKILNYLDIPIQHIDDKILRSMNRRGTGAEIEDLFEKLRRRLPGLVLRTSIIAGLPGEGEAEFECLCDFLRRAKIQRAGIFPFSPEEGTPAAQMPDQVPPEVAQRRVELLVDLQSRIMDEYNESLLGGTMEVLCEGFDQDAGCWRGRSWADSPDVDGHVYFTAAGALTPGTFVNVVITGTQDGDLTGEIEE
ncbi:MAG: 30S ribosomal protein S12 methylthiotransferase RimO [Oscillospiraceae bacterium]|nr:30S ribosomal protein S12 methylthiotransferase RimO [Oscillospiraceae bacterium]